MTGRAARFLPSPVRRSVSRSRARHRAGLPKDGRIFGLGLSRTGTTSLNRALQSLGFRSVHFPADPQSRAEVEEFLTSGRERDRLPLSVLDGADAITDTPVCATYEALDAAYPGSRFVLTVRERASWLESCRRFWAGTVEPFLAEHKGDSEARYMELLCLRLYGTVRFDESSFARGYDEYHARVHAHFADRPGDLLITELCAGEGWRPLCAFLRQPLPRIDFPWANSGLKSDDRSTA